jgi:hypothetical protein
MLSMFPDGSGHYVVEIADSFTGEQVAAFGLDVMVDQPQQA